jgi:hypothetical protein
MRVYQLNTGRTSVRNKVFLVLDFTVHFSHYMFRPRLAEPPEDGDGSSSSI